MRPEQNATIDIWVTRDGRYCARAQVGKDRIQTGVHATAMLAYTELDLELRHRLGPHVPIEADDDAPTVRRRRPRA